MTGKKDTTPYDRTVKDSLTTAVNPTGDAICGDKGEIVLYESKGHSAIKVRLEDETVWLNQKQMAELFNSERSVITKHIRNIFKTKELDEGRVSAIFAHTAADGKTYATTFYNLDMIISVAYRVNSIRGTMFQAMGDKNIEGTSCSWLHGQRAALEGAAEGRSGLSRMCSRRTRSAPTRRSPCSRSSPSTPGLLNCSTTMITARSFHPKGGRKLSRRSAMTKPCGSSAR